MYATRFSNFNRIKMKSPNKTKKLKRPERPVEFTLRNWRNRTDYDMAMQAYYNALAIYEMFDNEDSK